MKSTNPFGFASCISWQDIHLNHVTQSVMKVSKAAQIMSHTVVAGLSTLVSTGKEGALHSVGYNTIAVVNGNKVGRFSQVIACRLL
jgi:hypothetical protein